MGFLKNPQLMCQQAITVYVVDIGPHMHMDIELVSEALRTCFLSKVSVDVPES